MIYFYINVLIFITRQIMFIKTNINVIEIKAKKVHTKTYIKKKDIVRSVTKKRRKTQHNWILIRNTFMEVSLEILDNRNTELIR